MPKRCGQSVPSRAEIPTFHEFSTDWFNQQVREGGRNGEGLAPRSRGDLEWRLSQHLLPRFARMRLDEIDIAAVDAYRASKVGKLSPSTVNKTLSTLSAILERAVEYELIARNPARGRARRARGRPRARSFIDRADHLAALLDAAGELDRKALVNCGQRRALLATLAFAGLRIGECLGLRWRDVDLARGTITLRKSKTQAGERVIYLLPALRDELDALWSRRDPPRGSVVFATAAGTALGVSNVRTRILAPAVELANKQLAKRKVEPLPEGLTPHSLRRTYASVLFALGESPPHVMGQLGHVDGNVTLTLYARAISRRDGEPERLKALVEHGELAAIGSQHQNGGVEPATVAVGNRQDRP